MTHSREAVVAAAITAAEAAEAEEGVSPEAAEAVVVAANQAVRAEAVVQALWQIHLL